MRYGFMWRIGCFFVLVAVVMVGLFALLSWLIGSTLGGTQPGAAILIGLLVLLILGVTARTIRRAAAPVGELIEASGRVEAGDYSTRVPERGPREVRALARAFNDMSARLEETERQRRSALADVSHELRTPLAVIRGNVEGLIDGVYPADAEHLAPILEETRLMERLIEDLRTLTLLEAGSLALHREPTDLAALIRDAAGGYQAQADGAGVALTVTTADNIPDVPVDPARIREVVTNLLTNALRHTPWGGTVDVGLERRAHEAIVSVHDTGAGMSPEELERIFDRFYRSPDSPGSGLGLPIARNLVEAHGGTMTATSERGRGTTIRFTVPRDPPT